jgi:hypothetical protein
MQVGMAAGGIGRHGASCRWAQRLRCRQALSVRAPKAHHASVMLTCVG